MTNKFQAPNSKQQKGQALRHNSGQALRHNSGQAMILTVMLLTGVILSVTSLVALLTLYQVRQGGDIASSNQAIFAADAGIECALYKLKVKDAPVDCSEGRLTNGAGFKTVNEGGTIKSVGRSGKSARSFELSELEIVAPKSPGGGPGPGGGNFKQGPPPPPVYVPPGVVQLAPNAGCDCGDWIIKAPDRHIDLGGGWHQLILKPGDSVLGSGIRAKPLVRRPDGNASFPAGGTYWWAVDMELPPDFNAGAFVGFIGIWDAHAPNDSGPLAPLQIELSSDYTVDFNVRGGPSYGPASDPDFRYFQNSYKLGKLFPGQRTTFIVGSLISPVGWVEVWRDGKLILPRQFVPTTFGNAYVYIQQGLYSNGLNVPEQRINMTWTRVADSLGRLQ